MPSKSDDCDMQVAGGLEVFQFDVGNLNTKAFFQGHRHFDDVEFHPDPSISSTLQTQALTASGGRGSPDLDESPSLEKEPRLSGAVCWGDSTTSWTSVEYRGIK
jgi:hypothetical protein